jgi:hypothetical protein
MHPPTETVATPPETADALIIFGRRFLYLGLLLSSLLTLRLGGTLTLGDGLLGVSLVALLCSMGRARSRLPDFKMIVLAGFLVAVGGVLSASRSPDPVGDISVVARLVYLVLVLPWQASRLLLRGRDVQKAAFAFGYGAAICSFGAVLQSRLGSDIIPGAGVIVAGRYPGFTGHVSDLGGIAAAGLAFSLGGLRRDSSRSQFYRMVGIAASCLVGLLLSGSVSGLLAVLIAALTLMIRLGVSKRRMALLTLGGYIVLSFVGSVQHGTPSALDPVARFKQVTGQTVVTGQGGTDTAATRLKTIRLAVSGFERNPLVGVGLDARSAPILGDLATHNLWAGVAYQGGALALIGVTIPTILLIRRRPDRGPKSTFVQHQLFSASIAAVAFASTAPSSYNRYFWIPLSLSYAARISRESRPSLVRGDRPERLQPTLSDPMSTKTFN